MLGDGWHYSVPDWSAFSASCRANYKNDAILWATTPGSVATVDFYGTDFGAFVLAGNDAGTLEISIDGDAFTSHALYDTKYSKSLQLPYARMFRSGLVDGPHTATLRVTRYGTNGNVGGTAVRLFRIGANGIVRAGNVEWQEPCDVSGDSDVDTTGAFRYAYGIAPSVVPYNSATATVNGVTFFVGSRAANGWRGADLKLQGFDSSQNDNNLAWAAGITTDGDISANYRNMLGCGLYSTVSPCAASLTLRRLIPGRRYLVQLWCSRGGAAATVETLTIDDAVTLSTSGSASGAGLFPEGIHTSPLYFALSLDLLWRSDSPNPEGWLAELLEVRYGAPAAEVRSLAQKYLSTFYGNAAGRLTSSLIPSRPTLLPKKSDPNNAFNLNYDSSVLVGLCSDLVVLAERHGITPGLRYDLVDVWHLALANASYALYADVLDAFNAHDRAKFDAAAAAFMRLAEDEDALLACEPLLRHDTYLDLARAWGGNAAEKDLYAFNERLQITQWGPFGKPSIFEYAWKEWHGLISEYYLPRWKMFFDHAGKALDGQAPIKELFPSVDGWARPRYKANALYEKMAAFEEKWISTPESGCTADRRLGDAVMESRKMLAKYGEVFGKAFASNPLVRMRDRMKTLETTYRANIKTKGGKSKP